MNKKKLLNNNIPEEKNNNNNNEIIRDSKDVCLGYFFLIFGYFFFIIITFWLITSKINPPSDDIINKFPYIIQFFIRDKDYGIALIIYLPIMLALFAFRKLVLYSFRHWENNFCKCSFKLFGFGIRKKKVFKLFKEIASRI